MFNGMSPTEIANLKTIIPEFHDLEDEDILIHQASALSNIENHQPYSYDVAFGGYGQTSSRSLLSSTYESDHGENDDSQLALALARSLEEPGDDFDRPDVPEQANATRERHTRSENTTRERHTQITPHTRQDGIDPDRMTHEVAGENGVDYGDLIMKIFIFVFGVFVFGVVWFLVKKMLPAIWILVFWITTWITGVLIYLTGKLASCLINKFISDSVEDWILRIICYVFDHYIWGNLRNIGNYIGNLRNIGNYIGNLRNIGNF